MNKSKSIYSFLFGAPIGCLGGLIGLGGAEFRLPVLLGVFKYPPREAVAYNLAVSLITLFASLVFRLPNAPLMRLSPDVDVIFSLIAGGLLGAYAGSFAAKGLSERTLHNVILILLCGIGILLIAEFIHPVTSGGIPMHPVITVIAGVALGTGIGVVSSMLGVAGGELIIPSLILVFGMDVKLAGTASILISLPTVLMGIYRHYRNGAFRNASAEMKEMVVPMGIGSIIGSFGGGLLVGLVSGDALKLVLGLILLISAAKMARKKQTSAVRPS